MKSKILGLLAAAGPTMKPIKSMVNLVAVTAALLGFGAPLASHAAVLSYDLNWSGAGGYSMTGSFSFDTATIGGDNLITQTDLTAFTISFFDSTSNPLATYGNLTDAQLFSFHTDTLLIDQGPAINFIVGRISATDYVLIRANGCTGDVMVLYQGDGRCGAPALFLDRLGEVIATPQNAVPEPGTLALLGLGLVGLGMSRRRKAN